MKRENCVVGQRVKVKKREQDNSWFLERYRGKVGVVERVDGDGDIHVRFDCDDEIDWGKPHELKKVKGDAS